MMQQAKISIMCCLLIATSLFAQVKDVYLNDGRVIRGEVTETTTGYEVATEMGTIPLSRGEVRSIEDVDEGATVDPAGEYVTKLAELDAEDARAHIDLGRWAVDNGLLDEAQRLFKNALELEPENREAQVRLDAVNTEIALRDRPEDVAGPTEGPDESDAVADDARLDWLLTEDDVYKIRMAEVRMDDDVRVNFTDRQGPQEFSDSMEGRMIGEGEDRRYFDAREFKKMDEKEQFKVMLQELGHEDDEYMASIQIQEDPKAFVTFRRTVWPRLNTSCARSECHGGAEGAGGLKLIPTTGGHSKIDERTDYTNFLILDKSRGSAGKLINRDNPEESLLLKYGLASDKSDTKHPLVNGQEIKAIFPSTKDKTYEAMLAWIMNELNGPVHPDYQVRFTLPIVKIEAAKRAAEREAREGGDQRGDDGQAEEGTDGDGPEVMPEDSGEVIIEVEPVEEPASVPVTEPDDSDE